MDTVQAACPSSSPTAPGDPVDSENPVDPAQLGGGCAIAPNAEAEHIDKSVILNLLLVMSVLLAIPWRNHSGAKRCDIPAEATCQQRLMSR